MTLGVMMTPPTKSSKQPGYANKYTKYWRHGYRATIPALGSQRRIQALRAIGYTVPQLAEATGLSEVYLYQLSEGRRSERINKRHAQQIVEAYRTLCVQPLHNKGTALRAKNYAKKRGWYPPMAWDDIDTDKSASIWERRGKDREIA
jgi:transcriptional regulator with XRE-family HTH domain